MRITAEILKETFAALEVKTDHGSPDKIEFHPITPAPGPLLAIDGGNAELLTTPTVSVQLLRFGAVRWTGKAERIREEWMTVITGNADTYHATLTPLRGEHAFSTRTFDFTMAEQALLDGGLRGNLGRLGNVIRKVGELQFAAHLVAQGDLVVFDGNLQSTSAAVEHARNALLTKANALTATVVGFAKTADLSTPTGYPMTAAVRTLAEQYALQQWYTAPTEVLHSSVSINIHFAKLHPQAQHVFRIDSVDSGTFAAAVSRLAAVSADPVFFGYPYPLIVADQLARVSNEEKEGLMMEFIARAGSQYPTLRVATNALNAHGILDRIR